MVSIIVLCVVLNLLIVVQWWKIEICFNGHTKICCRLFSKKLVFFCKKMFILVLKKIDPVSCCTALKLVEQLPSRAAQLPSRVDQLSSRAAQLPSRVDQLQSRVDQLPSRGLK